MDRLNDSANNPESTLPPTEEAWRGFLGELADTEKYATEVRTQSVSSGCFVDYDDDSKPIELLCAVEQKQVLHPGFAVFSNVAIYYLLDIPSNRYPVMLNTSAKRDDRYLEVVDFVKPFAESAFILSEQDKAAWLRKAWEKVVATDPHGVDETAKELLEDAKDGEFLIQEIKDYSISNVLPNGDVISGRWQKRKDKKTGQWHARPQDCAIKVEQASGRVIEFRANQNQPAGMSVTKGDPATIENAKNAVSATFGDSELRVTFSGTRAFMRLKEGELKGLKVLPELDEEGLQLLTGVLRQANEQLAQA